MSVNQFPKSSAPNESNIPVPKKNTGAKKFRRCAQLPELQKYIETIIKASNYYDQDDTSQSDKDKFPKERKFASYSVYKGLDRKVKQEKNKTQLNMSGSKNNIKPKTPVPEAVSRGVRVYNTFGPEFEDPRNWKVGKTQNLGPIVEIEKFLKKFYPNPYKLQRSSEFKSSKRNKTGELRGGTLTDVVISKANIHTEVGIGKRYNDLQTADIEPCKRETKWLSQTSDISLETQSARRHQNNPGVKNVEGYSHSVPALSKKPTRAKSMSSNASSRVSSAESMAETFSSQLNFRKRKSFKPKVKSKPIQSDPLSDYDIGKLKLLNTSDSEQSVSKTGAEMRDVDIKPELCEEIYKTEDINDLKEIYDIMYKATQSFLQISSKNESIEQSKTLTESNEFSTKLNTELVNPELNLKLVNPSKTKLELSNSDRTEDKIHKTTEDKLDNDSTTTVKFEELEQTTTEYSLIDVQLKEDKVERMCNSEEEKPEPETIEEVTATSHPVEIVTDADSPKDKNDSAESNKKPDDIMDYMYDCLRNFGDEKSPPADRKTQEDDKSFSRKRSRKESATDINHETPTTSDFPWTYKYGSTDNLLPTTFPDIKDIKSKYSAALGEIHRKASRSRCKKRPTFTGSSPCFQIPLGPMPAPPESPPRAFQCYQNSTEETSENVPATIVPTVESQNELGNFMEELHEVLTVESRTPKPLCQLSVKQKIGKTNAGKTLKDVLEQEEKLLSSEQIAREKEENQKDVIVCAKVSQADVQNGATKVYSRLGDFKQPSSNFVVCVNSFSQNLGNAGTSRPNPPVAVSASLSDLEKNCNLKHIMLASTFPLKKHSLSFEEECYVLEHTYSIKQEALLTMSKIVVAYTARPVSLKITTSVPKPVEELLLKSSECMVTTTQQPVLEEERAPVVQEVSTEDEKPVNDLIQAIEDTEEKLYILEQSSAENLYSRNSDLSSLSRSEVLKNELSENEVERVSDKNKVHQLLLRTYNLQQKLHRYLQKMSCNQPGSTSCSLMQQEDVLNFSLGNSTEIKLDIMSESSLPVVHWHMKPPEVSTVSRVDESVTVKVLMVDDSTSYEPPMETKCDEPNQEKFGTENEETLLQDSRMDEDDRSSICSFKSSNDYSEQIEAEPQKDFDYMDSKKLFQKIYNEIESFKQSFEAERKQQQQQVQQSTVDPEDAVDRRLAVYDHKTPAKVLRTVFTGKKSSTELTIGLKDVPMTKVGNISVEKTKFSPNHTKISVAFTKTSETPGGTKKLSSYLFNHMGSSVSTCITEYSQLKDDLSKSSRSENGESEDDEDDYKSVGSTLASSDAEEEKREPKDQKTVEPSPPKNFTKHRFDFYRKMNPDLESTKSKPKPITSPVCKYKELEPLKQALTDMQIRMRNIRREAIFTSNDYYERALKLAKMSAGFCQSCGNRAVIPNDTFGYYRTLLPRRTTHRRNRHFRSTVTPNPSLYSLHSTNLDVGDRFCELGIKHSSYILNPRCYPNRTILRSSLHDMPILFEKI